MIVVDRVGAIDNRLIHMAIQVTALCGSLLADNAPEKLVRGWEKAYRRILTQFLSGLRASPQLARGGLRSQSR